VKKRARTERLRELLLLLLLLLRASLLDMPGLCRGLMSWRFACSAWRRQVCVAVWRWRCSSLHRAAAAVAAAAARWAVAACAAVPAI
jgi:hypothetical protein